MFNNLTIIILFFVITKSECGNILAIFPTPSISHQDVFRPLMKELAKRGHQVTVITADPAYPKGKTPQNYTEIDLHDLSYTLWNQFISLDKGKACGSQSGIQFIYELLIRLFEEQTKSPEVQALIHDRKRKFDLLFVENCVRPAIGYTHIYNVPTISISSLGPLYETFGTIGASNNPLIYPIISRNRINNLSPWETLSELYNEYKFKYLYSKLEEPENKLLKKLFGRNIPVIKELKKNIDMLILDEYSVWDSNRPITPNVLYLGGLHRKPSVALREDLKTFLDSSRNGVIYISFGTNVKTTLLPPEKLQIFTNVFSQLPYDVLWKWDEDNLPGHPKNVKISRWLPQSDLLRHPKIKLFITQGGLQSTDEAITAGVPLIGIPMLGDQWYNVELYVKHNIGLKLDFETITEDILKNAIKTIIDNESYRKNVINLRNVMHDQPQSSLEKAVWWTEHVLRHGSAAHLRSPAAHMHWTEYYAVDLLLLLLIILILFLIISFILLRIISSALKNIFNKIKIILVKKNV